MIYEPEMRLGRRINKTNSRVFRVKSCYFVTLYSSGCAESSLLAKSCSPRRTVSKCSPTTQCAAVSTWRREMRVPPQRYLMSPVRSSLYPMAACHGKADTGASWPPTTFGNSLKLIPHSSRLATLTFIKAGVVVVVVVVDCVVDCVVVDSLVVIVGL